MSRGDGPYTHGNSFANGPGGPKLSPEMIELLKMQVTIWTQLEPRP